MTTNAGTLIGHLTEVRGNEFVARLLADDEGFEPVVRFEDEEVMVGQIGGYVAVQQGGVHVVGLVARTWQEDPPIGTSAPRHLRVSRDPPPPSPNTRQPPCRATAPPPLSPLLDPLSPSARGRPHSAVLHR